MRLKVAAFFVLFFAMAPLKMVGASSETAYNDYLYQFDVYRQKYNEFQIAKNEYLKFSTLASEQAAITKTKEMLSQRALLLRAYLLLLQEKINETPPLTGSERSLYVAYIKNEVDFLEEHAQFVGSVQTIKDAQKASEQLESHYLLLSRSMRQITLGITLAHLRQRGDAYGNILITAKTILDQARSEFPLDKVTIFERWFTQMSNKRTIFLQKIDGVTNAIAGLRTAKSVQDMEKTATQIKLQFTDAYRELGEGESYTKEFIQALTYNE